MLRNELLKEEIAWQEILDKAKNQEPMEYDYSDSKRLVPNGYYRDFSDERKVRLHVGMDPIISEEGLIMKPLEERAADLVSDGK